MISHLNFHCKSCTSAATFSPSNETDSQSQPHSGNRNSTSPITAAQVVAAVPATPRWQPQPHWSIAPGTHEEGHDPDLVSPHCYQGLVQFCRQVSMLQQEHTIHMALMTETSLHPVDLDALHGQPWVYASSGLGNMGECPFEVCLAGGTGRDSLNFASTCMITECDASDLLAKDFVER